MIRSLFLAPLALAAFTSTALAHFQLIEPKQDRVDTQGKTGTCGDSVPSPTAVVSNLTPGQTLDVKVDVTTPHPGYFRVALAKGMDLPPVPELKAGEQCTALTANQQALPKYVLLEQKVKTATVKGQELLTVTVPNDMNCQDCRLQVVQVMAVAGTSCFYYHCAKVNVGTAITPPPEPAPTPPSPDAGPGDDNANNSGGGSTGGCSTTGGQLGWALLAVGTLVPFVRRRRA